MAINGYSLSTITHFVGQEIGVSDLLTIDQERINQFADYTKDHQWIHVDVERARRESQFWCTIAHGLLTLSLAASWQHAGVFQLWKSVNQ
jgi:acyl dehydratase